MSTEAMPHEDRKTYLGSHDTAAISGLHPRSKPINVYMDKLGMSIPEEPTERMRWGTALQPAILAEFAERMGGVDLEPERFIRHPTLAWFGGTPDATIAGRKVGVDAKNVQYNRGEWGEEGTDQVPRHILFQCHHFLALTGYDAWYVAALFGGCELRLYEVERDAELADMVVEMDGEFWRERIEKRDPPPPDDSESWQRFAARMYPKDNGEVRAATAEEMVILEELRDLDKVLYEHNARDRELRNHLREAMKDTAGLVSDAAKVSYRATKGRTDIDKTYLKTRYPDIAQECTRTGAPGRMFRITFKESEQWQ